ncbi:MAG: hypothetical protein ACRD3K_12135 [Edaphobacter sp.]
MARRNTSSFRPKLLTHFCEQRVEKSPHFAIALVFAVVLALAFLVVIPEGNLLLFLPLLVLLYDPIRLVTAVITTT